MVMRVFMGVDNGVISFSIFIGLVMVVLVVSGDSIIMSFLV